jgi:hypothetical protein
MGVNPTPCSELYKNGVLAQRYKQREKFERVHPFK